MSETKIPEKVLYTLWGRAGGICEICGAPLSFDTFTKKLKHRGYAAHIYGEKPRAPRYDKINSPKHCKDIDYIMLLCDSCHKRIDKDEPQNYPVLKLKELKTEHEQFIEIITSCKTKQKTQAITCCSKIGEYCPPSFDNNMLIEAIIKNNKRPTSNEPISVLNVNDGIDDSEDLYWQWHEKNLKTNYQRFLDIHSNVKHLSIFAIAPQPILILLGSLISELTDVDIYQKHRIDETWIWPDEKPNEVEFKVISPAEQNKKNVAINLSLSARISEDNITSVLGNDTSIWTITIDNPNKYFVNNKKIQNLFKAKFAELIDKIKSTSPNIEAINIFPAVPQSIAVCIGQVRMSKADLPFVIYDRNNKNCGFIKALEI